jgi:ElaB/YqjD/DUF883 family membrane-anchored ribosome-binding protein
LSPSAPMPTPPAPTQRRFRQQQLDDASADVKALVRDAQSVLTAAAALTGNKADELRERGMQMLDVALGKAGKVQDQAVVKGKELAHTADVYVKDNPWRTVAVAAGAACCSAYPGS